MPSQRAMAAGPSFSSSHRRRSSCALMLGFLCGPSPSRCPAHRSPDYPPFSLWLGVAAQQYIHRVAYMGISKTIGALGALAQVSDGSQSKASTGRVSIRRRMRTVTIRNQSSVAKAFQDFDEVARMKPSTYYDHIVDVIGGAVRFTVYPRHSGQAARPRYR